MVIRKTKEKRQNIKRASSWMLYYWYFLGMCWAIAAVLEFLLLPTACDGD